MIIHIAQEVRGALVETAVKRGRRGRRPGSHVSRHHCGLRKFIKTRKLGEPRELGGLTGGLPIGTLFGHG
jgi:hypothetical protein